GKLEEEGARALVGEVLGADGGEDAEVLDGERTSEEVEDLRASLARAAVLVGDLGRDRRPDQEVEAISSPASRATQACTARKSFRPSSLPVRRSTACSGCGMRPTTFRPGLHTPAILASAPFGFPSAVGSPTRST